MLPTCHMHSHILWHVAIKNSMLLNAVNQDGIYFHPSFAAFVHIAAFQRIRPIKDGASAVRCVYFNFYIYIYNLYNFLSILQSPIIKAHLLMQKVLFLSCLVLLLAINSLALTPNNEAEGHSQSTNKERQNSQQLSSNIKAEPLRIQNPQLIKILPSTVEQVVIDKSLIQKHIQNGNHHQVLSSYLLYCKTITTLPQIQLIVVIEDKGQEKVFNLMQYLLNGTSQLFSLGVLSQFDINEVQSIKLTFKSDRLSVVKIALMNQIVTNQIHIQSLSTPFNTIPFWLPNSYNFEYDLERHLVKYFYFRAEEHSRKIRIQRIKGHPKVYLYNCQVDKIEFCKKEIQRDHIQGILMLQKQIEVQIVKQVKCKDCLVMLAFKNMAIQTEGQIVLNSTFHSIILPKDEPILKQINKGETIQIFTFFKLVSNSLIQLPFLDISINQGKSKDIKIDLTSIKPMSPYRKGAQSIQLNKQDFKTHQTQKTIRIVLNTEYNISGIQLLKEGKEEIWFEIIFTLTSSEQTLVFSVVDTNSKILQQRGLILNDGQIFHSYLYQNPTISSFASTFQFKVNVLQFSTLIVSTACKSFEKLGIEYKSQRLNLTKIIKKLYIENTTHLSKICSQLIHLNPNQLFDSFQSGQMNQNTSKDNLAYFSLYSSTDQIDLLYSSVDIVLLQKSFPYHSSLKHNQSLHFYLKDIKQIARINIQKCSDCHVNLAYSEQQLVDVFSPRTSPINRKDIQSLQQSIDYKLQNSKGLFIKLTTNNFAHVVIDVIQKSQSTEIQQIQDIQRKVGFSLEQNNKLTLQFDPPHFIESRALNSIAHYFLIEGSVNVQVAKETYCPQFIFNEKERTRDISVTKIIPQLTNSPQGIQKLKYELQLKHHDFFGIRAQKGSETFSYQIVNIQMMKEYSLNRWSIFHVVLFLTFAAFMSFVCFMGLKKKRIRKVGGEIVVQDEDDEQTSMVDLKDSSN